jgi:hypothetical protein
MHLLFSQFLKLSTFVLIVSMLSLSCNSTSEAEQSAWAAASEQNTLEALDSFLNNYPKTQYSKEIAQRREGILWALAQRNKTEYYYRYYLKEFPQGAHHVEAAAQLEAMPEEDINLQDLSAKTLVGTVRYENEQQLEVIALQFKSLDQTAAEVKFRVNAHLSHDVKKELWGRIELPEHKIFFEENREDEFILGLSNGRIYMRNGNILIESTDPKQYWMLR